MDQPKHDPKPPIPAVELSLQPLEVDIPTTRRHEHNPPPPINLAGSDPAEFDENDLGAGAGGSVRYLAQPASPAARPKRE